MIVIKLAYFFYYKPDRGISNSLPDARSFIVRGIWPYLKRPLDNKKSKDLFDIQFFKLGTIVVRYSNNPLFFTKL